MDFSTSKTENLFLQMIREFAEKEVKPLAAAVDEEERFPEETVKKMAARSFFSPISSGILNNSFLPLS